jgi:hypothetical protein
MTVFDTRAARATSSTANSGPAARTASVAAIVAENLVQPGVYAAVGLDQRRARAAVRGNAHYAGKLRDAAAGLVSFLRGTGLIGGPSELLWKRAHLL